MKLGNSAGYTILRNMDYQGQRQGTGVAQWVGRWCVSLWSRTVHLISATVLWAQWVGRWCVSLWSWTVHRISATVLNNREAMEISVPGKKFHVSVAGCTNGAHESYVNDLKRSGQIEVISPEQSDYLVLFCPIASRVGTDIGEAMNKISGGKPIVLVVMHHTYEKDHFVPESRRVVENPDVIVTVDVLFHESKMLICNRNDTAWSKVKDVLGVSPGPVSSRRSWMLLVQSVVEFCGWCMKFWSKTLHPILATVPICKEHPMLIICGFGAIIILYLVMRYTQKKEDLGGLQLAILLDYWRDCCCHNHCVGVADTEVRRPQGFIIPINAF